MIRPALLLLSLTVGLWGCQSFHTGHAPDVLGAPDGQAHTRTPVPAQIQALIQAARLSPEGLPVRLHTAILIAGRTARLALTAFVLADQAHQQVTLIGMNEWGFKLVDIRLEGPDTHIARLPPMLARLPGFGDSLAKAVRRLFLILPSEEDRDCPTGWTLRQTAQPASALCGKRQEAYVEFAFQDGTRLTHKQGRGPDGPWRVHQEFSVSGPVPSDIVYEDLSTGMTLTMKLQVLSNHE